MCLVQDLNRAQPSDDGSESEAREKYSHIFTDKFVT